MICLLFSFTVLKEDTCIDLVTLRKLLNGTEFVHQNWAFIGIEQDLV